MTNTKSSRSKSSSSRGSSSNRSASRRTGSGSGRRSRRSTSSSLPSWLPYALGGLGLCALVYGIMQISAVSEFMDPMVSDVSDFFGLSEDDGIDSENITHDRSYSSSMAS